MCNTEKGAAAPDGLDAHHLGGAMDVGKLSANTIKGLAMDAVQQTQSWTSWSADGHVGYGDGPVVTVRLIRSDGPRLAG